MAAALTCNKQENVYQIQADNVIKRGVGFEGLNKPEEI
jgi:hypothetical protein